MKLVCRTCLETTVEVIHLFNHFENGKALSEILMDCVAIQLKEDDRLPCHICSKCMEKLTTSWRFRVMVIESESKLHKSYGAVTNQFKSPSSTTDSVIMIKEEPSYINNSDIVALQIPDDNVIVAVSNSNSTIIHNNFQTKKEKDLSQYDYEKNTNNFISEKLMTNTGVSRRAAHANVYQDKDAIGNLSQYQSSIDIISTSINPSFKEGLVDTEISTDNIFQEKLLNSNQFSDKSMLGKNNSSAEYEGEHTKLDDDSKIARTVFCKQCNKAISYRYYYKVHAPSHNGNRPFKCNICQKSFVTNYLLTLHKSVHTEERPHICDLCGKNFKTYRIMRFHRSLHVKGRSHICKLCNAGFKLKASLEAHVAIHNNVKKYVCEICGKSFTTGSNLSVHKSSHITEKTLPCTSCDKLFSSKKKLKVHLRSHSDNRPHTCNYCTKSFKTSGEKKRHTSMHTGAKPYSCKICHKAFSDCSSIGRHMLIHTGEMPYSCEKCPLKFKYKQQFDKHLKKHK